MEERKRNGKITDYLQGDNIELELGQQILK